MNTTIQIRKLNALNLEEAFDVIYRAIRSMRENGIEQWDELYPDRAVLAEDIAHAQAFGLFFGDSLAAYVTLNEDEAPEYRSIPWSCATGRHLVIHRLCVDPSFQGKGIAKRLLCFAEEYAREHGYSDIRLDAFSLNPVALHMYEQSSYARLGTVRFRKGSFFCYEKVLG